MKITLLESNQTFIEGLQRFSALQNIELDYWHDSEQYMQNSKDLHDRPEVIILGPSSTDKTESILRKSGKKARIIRLNRKSKLPDLLAFLPQAV